MIKESKPRITLDVEFDVADSVVPASGIFWVKLVKRGLTYGITLSGNISLIVSVKTCFLSGPLLLPVTLIYLCYLEE